MQTTSTPPGPQRFGPYLIVDRIGDGGMAEIFAAKMQGYSGFEKHVALKRILPRYSQNPSFASMLIHEAKLAAKIQHFNVVQVLDLGEIDKQVYIAMEYVRGKDLAAMLSNTYRRKEKLPVELSLFIATEFLTGLDYAHRLQSDDGRPLGLIHRDISPQNVLISLEGEVKVTDFGIARVISPGEGFQLPGNLHGKFGYMSPEQVRGQQLDQRSDVFSSGVVLHEMLTGQRLFRGKNPQATVQLILGTDVKPPSEINPAVPPEVDRICLMALAKNRDERYQTIGAFLGELSRTADRLERRAARRDLAVYMRRQFGALVSRQTREGAASTSHVSPYSPTAGTRTPIGEILVALGALTIGELEIGLAEQRARGGRIGEVLLETGVISEGDLVTALSRQSQVPALTPDDLAVRQPDPELLQRFPREVAEATKMLPIGLSEDQRKVLLVVEDPFDQRGILEARVVLGVDGVDVCIAARSAIQEQLYRWYPSSGAPAAGASGYRPVLIADPDEEFVNEFADRIREEEFEVLVAHDGKAAREFCRNRDPAVVFLDASLPKIDGYNVLLELRSRGSDAAAFVTSARDDEFHQAKALELGADDFLVKPISIEVTTSKVRREMQKRKQGQRAMVAPTSLNGVSGSLNDMSLVDIVQSLELGRKSAHVMIQYEDGRTGELGFEGGNATSCLAGGRLGDDAFYWLARPGEGLFRIEYKQPTHPKNIKSPNTFLILEALKRVDEANVVEPKTEVATKPPNSPAPERPTMFQVNPKDGTPAPPQPARSNASATTVPPRAVSPSTRAALQSPAGQSAPRHATPPSPQNLTASAPRTTADPIAAPHTPQPVPGIPASAPQSQDHGLSWGAGADYWDGATYADIPDHPTEHAAPRPQTPAPQSGGIRPPSIPPEALPPVQISTGDLERVSRAPASKKPKPQPSPAPEASEEEAPTQQGNAPAGWWPQNPGK